MIHEIIVLTDDIRIKEEVESINGRVEMITEKSPLHEYLSKGLKAYSSADFNVNC